MEIDIVCQELCGAFIEESTDTLVSGLRMLVFGLILSGFDEACHLLTSLLSVSALESLISSGALFFHSIYARNENCLCHLNEKFLSKLEGVEFEMILCSAIEAGFSISTILSMIKIYMRVTNTYVNLNFPNACIYLDRIKVEVVLFKKYPMDRGLLAFRDTLMSCLNCNFENAFKLLVSRFRIDRYKITNLGNNYSIQSRDPFSGKDVERLENTLLYELCTAAVIGRSEFVLLLIPFLANRTILTTFLSTTCTSAPESLIKQVIQEARNRGLRVNANEQIIKMSVEAGCSPSIIAEYMGCPDGHAAEAIQLACQWHNLELLASIASIFKYALEGQDHLPFLNSCIGKLTKTRNPAEFEFVSKACFILLGRKSGLILGLRDFELACTAQTYRHIMSNDDLWNIFAWLENRTSIQLDNFWNLRYVRNVLKTRWTMRHLRSANIMLTDVCILVVEAAIRDKR